MLGHFAMFAAYNRWANERLYAAVATLPEADFIADRGAFFGSLRGTLNHLLVTDLIWLHRLTGGGSAPDRLDAILHRDFAGLEQARRTEDARLIAYVAGVTEADLAGDIHYRRLARPTEPISQPRAAALAHLFNHQTHHRGQAHTLLTIIGGRDAGPSMDLVEFQRTLWDRRD